MHWNKFVSEIIFIQVFRQKQIYFIHSISSSAIVEEFWETDNVSVIEDPASVAAAGGDQGYL